MSSKEQSFKLGLNPSEVDVRNIPFSAMLAPPRILPAIPESYEVDRALGYTFVESLFGNDKWGDCAVVGRANQTLRFEFYSQKKQIPITTQECLDEYWLEQGYVQPKCFIHRTVSPPPDNGLTMLGTLKAWRSLGWKAAGKKYSIYAFLSIPVGNDSFNMSKDNPTMQAVIAKDDLLLKQAVYFLSGALVAVSINQATMNQFKAGQVWDAPNGFEHGSLGGHALYIVGYNAAGLVAVTWAKKVQITWRWWRNYCLEAFATVDNKNDWQKDDPIDIVKLQSYLDALTT